MSEPATDTPRFVLLLQSMDVQIFPIQVHQCGVATGQRITSQVGVAVAVAWLRPIGNYVAWACPHCETYVVIHCDLLARNVQRRDALLDGDKAPDGGSSMFMSVNEWLRRSQLMSRDTLQALIADQ
jgi:hypothetical protein